MARQEKKLHSYHPDAEMSQALLGWIHDESGFTLRFGDRGETRIRRQEDSLASIFMVSLLRFFSPLAPKKLRCPGQAP